VEANQKKKKTARSIFGPGLIQRYKIIAFFLEKVKRLAAKGSVVRP